MGLPTETSEAFQPRMSPDGRYVVVTNTSTLSGESFLLRIDLRTGAVLNLTNGTAGALPTDDAEAAYSSDGTRLAFSWSQGDPRGVYVMNSESGKQVRNLATGDQAASSPVWAPDGDWIAYLSTGGGDRTQVMRANITGSGGTAGSQRVSRGVRNAWSPVISPDGQRTGFLALSGKTVGLWVVEGAGRPQPVGTDLFSNITSVDWR